MSESKAEDASARCPKCAAPRRRDREACDRCGLIFANWTPDATPAVQSLDDEAEALWEAAEADWQDQAKHEAFLKHCSPRGMLGAAGRRYRERVEADEGDEMAARMQGRVLGMATALLGPPPQRPQRSFIQSPYFYAILLLFAVLGMAAGLLFKF